MGDGDGPVSRRRTGRGGWRRAGWWGHTRQATQHPPSAGVQLVLLGRAGLEERGLVVGGGLGGGCYRTPSMKLVSRCWMSTRMKDISLRVFSKMIRGSSDWQRRQLGAITMARLLTSILVTATLAGCTNTWGGRKGRRR